jgi:EAL domain-containing protein (putative c-di-GMP-specific phosphodiesterase class I)
MHQLTGFAGVQASPTLDVDGETVSGRFAGFVLRSVFQPLFLADTLQPVAHEALLRVSWERGPSIPPQEAFARVARLGHAVTFDRFCRLLHVMNFQRRSGPVGSLFLNIQGDHLLGLSAGEHGSFISSLISQHNFAPDRVVIEIVEDSVDDLWLLESAIRGYRQRGMRIAIDDFGARHSNFDRLWSLAPDVVKLDRTLILQAISNPMARRILPKIIEIIHELGAQAVCEGIETEDQFLLARDSGADLLQGFHFAMPSEHVMMIESRTPEGGTNPIGPTP